MTERVDFYVLKERDAEAGLDLRLPPHREGLRARSAGRDTEREPTPMRSLLDELLWTFSDRASCRIKCVETSIPTRRRDTPVHRDWPRSKPAGARRSAGQSQRSGAVGPQRFGRIAEIIDADAERRRLGGALQVLSRTKLTLETHQLDAATDI